MTHIGVITCHRVAGLVVAEVSKVRSACIFKDQDSS
jgi:hypothetical protein